LTVTVQRPDVPGAQGESFEIEGHPTAIGPSFVYLADGRHVDAAVTPSAVGQVLVQVGAKDLIAQVGSGSRRNLARLSSGHGEEVRIRAPMPGRVVRVLVAAGDAVSARQGLVIIEAMKMENELGAPREGRVREVTVTEGTSVESGRVLVVIE
jgi:biotin carboxyl carrier protein